jgi:hypothetical protein
VTVPAWQHALVAAWHFRQFTKAVRLAGFSYHCHEVYLVQGPWSVWQGDLYWLDSEDPGAGRGQVCFIQVPLSDLGGGLLAAWKGNVVYLLLQHKKTPNLHERWYGK